MIDTELAYGLVKFLHILLFVYWLGGDVGVYYSSGFVIDPTRSRDARLMAFKIFVELDMLPRYCMALMLSVGALLAHYIGVPHLPWQLPLILALGPFWLAMAWAVHHYQGKPLGQTLGRIDYAFRWVVIVAIVVSVTVGLSDGRLTPYPWLAAKLLIFASLVLSGVIIRHKLPRFLAGFRVLAAGAPTPQSDEDLSAGLRACRPYVLYIWFGLAVSALLGVLQPGS